MYLVLKKLNRTTAGSIIFTFSGTSALSLTIFHFIIINAILSIPSSPQYGQCHTFHILFTQGWSGDVGVDGRPGLPGQPGARGEPGFPGRLAGE